MKALRNLAPFRWWRTRHALPLVPHGPKTQMDWAYDNLAASIERSMFDESRTPAQIRGLAAQVDRAFWGLS